MPEPIFLQLVEKMLAQPSLDEHVSKAKSAKLKELLSREKLPTKAELTALLAEADVEDRVDQGQ